MILSVFVQDDQCADNARHPPAEGEDKDNEHRPAPAVDNGQRREKDGEEDAEEGHDNLLFISSPFLKTYR